jgi:hypothetical protein
MKLASPCLTVIAAGPAPWGRAELKSFAAMFAAGRVAPEREYITAKFAALAPFARVGDLYLRLPVRPTPHNGLQQLSFVMVDWPS